MEKYSAILPTPLPISAKQKAESQASQKATSVTKEPIKITLPLSLFIQNYSASKDEKVAVKSPTKSLHKIAIPAKGSF
ncbi:MAG: hypothetical protein ACYCQI_15845 [Gammaproteobacteria bacterium]